MYVNYCILFFVFMGLMNVGFIEYLNRVVSVSYVFDGDFEFYLLLILSLLQQFGDYNFFDLVRGLYFLLLNVGD